MTIHTQRCFRHTILIFSNPKIHTKIWHLETVWEQSHYIHNMNQVQYKDMGSTLTSVPKQTFFPKQKQEFLRNCRTSLSKQHSCSKWGSFSLIQLTSSDSTYGTILNTVEEEYTWSKKEEKGKKRKTSIIISTFLIKTKALLIHCDSDTSRISDAHFLWKFNWEFLVHTLQ
jgi:hypothetical protein